MSHYNPELIEEGVSGRTLQFFKSDMNKTWFLTREEAEAALEIFTEGG